MAYTPVSPASYFDLVSAVGTNATNIKTGSGTVNGWYIYNSTTGIRKVAFHDNAGTPTAGTGVVMALVIPPLSAANVSLPDGIQFTTGIAITTVTGLADSNNGGVQANDLVINIFYK